MTAKISNIYQKTGLLSLQDFRIGTNNNVSDFNFLKLREIEKIMNLKNIDWCKLSKSKEEILFQIDSLNII
jgi:hypothetical protein